MLVGVNVPTAVTDLSIINYQLSMIINDVDSYLQMVRIWSV